MEIDGLTEHELWRLSLERDGRAFAKIFDLHRDRVFQLAHRLVESTAVANSELENTLRRMRKLSGVDRQLILFVAVEGLPLPSASEVLGLSYGAAKTRLSRARRRLADSVGQARGGLFQEGSAG